MGVPEAHHPGARPGWGDSEALRKWMATLRHEVDLRLERLVPDEDAAPEELHRAVRYSLLAPGKRIRPILAITAAEALGGVAEFAVDPACAIEMVHTASLIVDDLPSMDDATMRRGRLTCHRVHGEDLATLASVYLLNRAHGVLAQAPGLRDAVRVSLVSLVSRMVGDEGIVAGQVRDLHHQGPSRSDPASLERMAREKTAALFVAAAEAGALVAQAPTLRIEALREFAWNLGLCFQVLDDLLDRHGTWQAVGKDVDQDGLRSTFLTVLGHDGARGKADSYLKASIDALDTIGPDAEPLRRLALFLLNSFAAKAERF